MKLFQKEAWFVSLFVCLGILDLCLRFFWLERENWTCNTGIFWGLQLNSQLLPGIILLMLLGLIFLWYRSEKKEECWGISLLLLGGGINALERLFYGCVLDYFAWPFELAQLLPNFNLADIVIVLGTFSLIWAHVQKERRFLIDRVI